MSAILRKYKHRPQNLDPESPTKNKGSGPSYWRDQTLGAIKRSVSNLRGTQDSASSKKSSSSVERPGKAAPISVPENHGGRADPSEQVGAAKHDQYLMEKHARSPQPPRKKPDLSLDYSLSSGFESSTPDSSGLDTNQSSHLTTPSPGNQLAQDPATTEDRKMGQNPSNLKQESVPLHETGNLDCFSVSPPPASNPSSTDSSVGRDPDPPVPPHRSNSVQVPIPRRGSSLTAINLDYSHFNRLISPGGALKHRASTLTSRFKQGSPDTIVPLDRTLTQSTLSPPS